MSAKPLTKVEADWLKKLEAVMKACPSERMECFTIGDNDITFYDKEILSDWEKKSPRNDWDVCRMVAASGAELARVGSNFLIVSSAG